MFILGSYHRSGTKLIHNIFRELKNINFEFYNHFNDVTDEKIKNLKCLVIIRHPYEIIMSGMRAHQLENQDWLLEPLQKFNYKSYREMILNNNDKISFEIENEGKNTILNIYNYIKNRNSNGNILFIKLEDFYQIKNLDTICEKIIKHLELSISIDDLYKLCKKHLNIKYNMTKLDNDFSFKNQFKNNHYKLINSLLPEDLLEILGYGKTTNMIVYAVDKKNRIYGGFGDRIVGLVSCKLLSVNLNKEFYIKWDIDNLNLFFEFNDLNESIDVSKIKKERLFIMDNLQKNKDIIKKNWNKLREHNYFISSNLNLNELMPIKQNNFLLQFWKGFYEDILIPKDILISKLKKIPNNLIGIQIRAGDNWMKTGSKHKPIKNENEISDFLKNIKNFIELNYSSDKIFITSDHPNINEIGTTIFNTKLFTYTNLKVCHLEKNNLEINDYLKLYLDHLILSKKCKVLLISKYSNFGRTSALINSTDKIYDFKNLDLLKKEDLLTK